MSVSVSKFDDCRQQIGYISVSWYNLAKSVMPLYREAFLIRAVFERQEKIICDETPYHFHLSKKAQV